WGIGWFWCSFMFRTVKPIPTKEIYTTENGTYQASRRIVHDRIIQRLLKQAGGSPGPMRQQACLLGGGTASGKTTLLERVIKPKLRQQGIAAPVIDADRIKPLIPEYRKL